MVLNRNLLGKFSNTKFNLVHSILIVAFLSIINTLLINSVPSKAIYVLSVMLVTILLSFNIQLLLYFLIIVILTPGFANIHHSVFLVLFFIPSIFFNNNLLHTKLVKNPLIRPLLVFITLASISLINAPKDIFTLLEYTNIVALCILVLIGPFILTDYSKIKGVFFFFTILMVLHSIYVIIQALSSNGRAFGLLGVFYVDFAGLAFLYSLLFFIYELNHKRIVYGLFALINLAGLIFSQTRNAWLSTSLMLILLFSLLLIKNKKLFVNRTFLVGTSIIAIIFLILFLNVFSNNSNLNVEKRLESKTQQVNLTENTESVQENSFVSRLFIWHTAINAFSQKPVLGIGLYSFKYVSNQYYTIPKTFFKQFVKNKTPHVGYLEILVETGIVGFIGFIYFLILIINLVIRMIRIPADKQIVLPRLLIFISLFYITFSMLVTEAWLYGQYLVWFAIILGALVSDYKITYSQSSIKNEP